MDNPQNPTVTQAARRVETLGVIGQKSAEAIVVQTLTVMSETGRRAELQGAGRSSKARQGDEPG